MTKLDTIGRTFAAIALTFVASASMLIMAVGPANQGNAAQARAIAGQSIWPEPRKPRLFSLAWKCLGNRTVIRPKKDQAEKGNGKKETLVAFTLTSTVRG